ncbi:hypothetical protein [Rhizobium rhizogenes]|uniref:hypothetical protein n=1 Tax=Rhizobium rhizogenes TaxID=359 RepID=UPI000647B255|nr:hypothetical protein [Rhizobium rhizogenes]
MAGPRCLTTVFKLDTKQRHGLGEFLFRVGEGQRQALLSRTAVYFSCSDDALGMITAFGRQFDELQSEPDIGGNLKGEGRCRKIHNGAGRMGLIEIYLPIFAHFDLFRIKLVRNGVERAGDAIAAVARYRSLSRLLNALFATAAPQARGLSKMPMTNCPVFIGVKAQ